MSMKKNLLSLTATLIILASCSNGMISCAENNNKNAQAQENNDGRGPGGPGGGQFGGPGGSFGQSVEIKDDGSTTDYVDATTAAADAVISDDLYENFTAEGTVEINFNGTGWTASFGGAVTDSDVSIKAVENSAEDEAAAGVEIQYKGKAKLQYVLSGNYTGTVFIKNKSADAAVILAGVTLTSSNGAGPVLRFSSEKRTFIVAKAGTTNTLTDTRLKDQSTTMYDDKKGSLYSKGTLIFTGDGSAADKSGTLNIINTGYKHAVYSKDYVRIADGINLNITVEGETGRDCIRTLNAVIIDGGNINLVAKGTLEDDESNGIRVDGEDADEDDMTVEYTAGAGFVIINGGKLTINTVAKGITAHWKSAKSVIGDSSYTATANTSLLCSNYLKGTSATVPNPFVEINGGNINVITTGQPYEGRTDDDPSCSPEGIEAKADLTINAGNINLQTTDDAINAGGNIIINGGAIYACSSLNDAIDSNGQKGITINGGVIVAIGGNGAECAFDCDNAPLTINGGYLLGFGGSNYTAPSSSGKQMTMVLGGTSAGSANTSFAVYDSKNNPVFVYTLPAASGELFILSSPELKTGTSYSVKTGVTVKTGSASRFHNLYITMPSVSGGTESLSNISTTGSSTVFTDSNAGRGGFGGGRGANGNFGGRNAFGNQEDFGGRGGNFRNGQLPEDMPEPPDGMNFQRGGKGNKGTFRQ